MNYYISDLHFSHANVIRFDSRPYENVEEMNEDLTKRWNSTVKPGDFVYIIGDLCWLKANDWFPIVSRLNGNLVLIRGNHDPEHLPNKLRKLFSDVKDIKTINDGGYMVTMCHYPLMFYPRSYSEKSIMLCGHVHTTAENKFLEAWRAEAKADPTAGYARIINVGCMMPYMDYTPRTLKEILERTGI